MDPIKPKAPDESWLESYFVKSLRAVGPYHIDALEHVQIKLDQNESPWDWPDNLKTKILAAVGAKPWNRYPNPFVGELNQLLGAYTGVAAENILTGPGSNYLITLLLDTMTRTMTGRLVILQPSFSLFELHAKYTGLDYDVWPLDKDLEYSALTLPDLKDGSIVLFASPNNPTGSSMPHGMLEQLLSRYPKVLFVADEAYHEFAGSSFVNLLADHSNLVILRTMSKTMGAAGIRLGYLIGSQALVSQLAKPRLPYLLNHFVVEAAIAVLRDKETQAFIAANIAEIRTQREKTYTELVRIGARQGFKVKYSAANFFLLQWPETKQAIDVYLSLKSRGILVRDVTGGAGLAGCLRITLGNDAENKALIAALEAA